MNQDKIVIRGLRQNNLKNVSLDIPKGKIVVFTGVSGSGKSSIVFDLILKRLTTLLLTMILCLSLEACSIKAEDAPNSQEIHTQATAPKGTEETQTKSSDAIAPFETTETLEEPVQLNPDLIGPWHLDQGKNDLVLFTDSLELFPGYGEWGPVWKFAATVK